MKKLSSLFEQNVTVGSLNLSNVSIDSDSSSDLISSALLKDINTAASNANVKVEITTAVSGHSEKTSSGNSSRHPDGFAVDISKINNKPVSTNKKEADNFVSQLKSMGYDTSGEETKQTPKSVLWQVSDHYDHVHVSNTTGSPSSSYSSSSSGTGTSTTASGDVDTYAKQVASNFIGNMIGTALGMTESKQERILKDIQKIKNLL